MTLEDIKAMDREMLTAEIVSKVIGADPQNIRVAALQKPYLLGFPVCIIGNRVKIPRRPFIKFMEGKMKVKQDEQ